jgi:hypothetical protein
MRQNKVVFILILCLTITLSAQSKLSENTFTLDEGSKSPPASLNSISWLEGHWRGEAFGGIVEEIWSPPLGGSMMCSFKLVVDDKVKFYEIVTIVEENETLILRLKHFHPDLKGWEEKDETVDFPLVKVGEKKVYFDGFTIEQISEDEINIFVMIGDKDNIQEAKFNYHRVI